MLHVVVDGVEYRFFDHLYAISIDGKVLRKLKPYFPKIRNDGYFSLGRRRLLHRAVADLWCYRPEGANHVHHINHNKSDNCASNLEWVTPKLHMSERHAGMSTGHKMSEAGKEKLRQLRLGTKHSENTKQKIRQASIQAGCKPPPRPVGTRCSQEAIERMRENSPNAMQCEINGVVYRSFSEAGRLLNEKPHTLRKRCLSESFPNYRIRMKDSELNR